MSGFVAAMRCELLKARRSKVPVLTAAAFGFAPVVGAFFMVILQDPERARSMGLIGSKAQILGGTADWPAYLALLAQSTAVGGMLVFAVVTTWVFGREFSDRTVKDLLALPTSRAAIVAAKFATAAIWILALSALAIAIGLCLGALIRLEGFGAAALIAGLADIGVAALLTMALMPWVAFFASIGRGYLPPMGWALLTVFLAQVVSATGWGHWFPWAVPPLLTGLAGPPVELGLHAYALVIVTGATGAAATFLHWLEADQSR